MPNVISEFPPSDGQNWECQCARCGSSADYTRCDQCEDGYAGHNCGEDVCCCLYPEENMVCQFCKGHGGWWSCLSSTDFCTANPLPGREEVRSGMIEWFTVKEPT